MSVKDYRIGDKIIDCKPLVHCLKVNKKSHYCDNCFRRISKQSKCLLEALKCSDCLKMYYCCYDCKMSDLRIHQKECKIFEKYFNTNLEHHFYRIILRLYLLSIEDKRFSTQQYELYDGNRRCLNQLETHFSQIKKDLNLLSHFQFIYGTVYLSSKQFGFQWDYQLLDQLFCRFVINHFDILSYSKTRSEPIGSGLYIEPSVLNHSCQPNAATIYFGTTLVLKAIKPIKRGEEITICYVDLEMDRIERQKLLKNSFYFECQCIRCESNDFEVDYNLFNELKKKMKSESMKETPDWSAISQLSDRWVDISFQIYGRFHPQLTPLLIEILSAKFQNKAENSNHFNKYLKQLQQIVELIFGSNHSLYKTFEECIKTQSFTGF